MDIIYETCLLAQDLNPKKPQSIYFINIKNLPIWSDLWKYSTIQLLKTQLIVKIGDNIWNLFVKHKT